MLIAGFFAPILEVLTTTLRGNRQKGLLFIPASQQDSCFPPSTTAAPQRGRSINSGNHRPPSRQLSWKASECFAKSCLSEFRTHGKGCRSLKLSAQACQGFLMKPESRQALFHVAAAGCLCVAVVYAGVFEGVFVQVGYEHYAEMPVASLPALLAMPFNSLINLAYVFLGLYWLRTDTSALGRLAEARRARYLKDVFAAMALLYGPIQWLRIATQTHPIAVLDQWVTLPIFAWPVAWCLYLDRGWKPCLFLSIECLSLASYSLALLHPYGFEVTLGVHVAAAIGQSLRVYARYGSASSTTYLVLGVLSCLGFLLLKLCDHQLAQWRLFQHLTGHFWSKVCDVLQFHFVFLFLTNLNTCQRPHRAGKVR